MGTDLGDHLERYYLFYSLYYDPVSGAYGLKAVCKTVEEAMAALDDVDQEDYDFAHIMDADGKVVRWYEKNSSGWLEQEPEDW